MIEFRIARGLRRHHGVDRVDVVVADVAIIGEQIIGMAARRLQLVGLHRHAGDERGDVIRRAAEHAVGEVGDAAVTIHPPLQVVARTGTQIVDRVAATVFLERHLVAQRGIGFHVVERRHRLRGVAERRMLGDVIDPFRSDIDNASITDRFEVLLAGTQHVRDLPRSDRPHHVLHETL